VLILYGIQREYKLSDNLDLRIQTLRDRIKVVRGLINAEINPQKKQA